MSVIWFLLLSGASLTACQNLLNNDVILSSKNENNHDGSYKYSYQTSNGISVEEEGSLKNPGTEGEAQTARGTYSYTAPDGQLITVNWYADETGFHAKSSHIPGSGVKAIQTPQVQEPSTEEPPIVFPIPPSPEFFRG